jgi:hypothetical protein
MSLGIFFLLLIVSTHLNDDEKYSKRHFYFLTSILFANYRERLYLTQ